MVIGYIALGLLGLFVLFKYVLPVAVTLWESATGCEDDYESRIEKRGGPPTPKGPGHLKWRLKEARWRAGLT